VKGSYGSILLKKSAMVSTVEKYALEIEIFTLSRRFGAQISRCDAQKKTFSAVSMGAVWTYRLFQQNRSTSARRDRQNSADSVEKVGHGFHDRKVRV
jgi:hypothetical protein